MLPSLVTTPLLSPLLVLSLALRFRSDTISLSRALISRPCPYRRHHPCVWIVVVVVVVVVMVVVGAVVVGVVVVGGDNGPDWLQNSSCSP